EACLLQQPVGWAKVADGDAGQQPHELATQGERDVDMDERVAWPAGLGVVAHAFVLLLARPGPDALPVARAVQADHGSPLAPGWPLAGQPAYLFRGDTEVLFEVSGELVGATVAVREDDVLDGCHGQRWILQAAAAFLQAQPFEQLHRGELGVLEYLVQVARR